MAECKFLEIPTEVVQGWVRCLDRAELCAYRLACKQAESQSFEIFAKRYFSTLKTSLIGSDVEKLQEISMSAELRKHVKSIYIQDGCQRSNRWTPYRDSPQKDNTQMIKTDAMGVKTLKTILADCRLCPESIHIRDHRLSINHMRPEPIADLAQEIYDGANLAILSLNIQQSHADITKVDLEFSKQHQGQNVGFSMLRSGILRFRSNLPTYWIDRVLFGSPSLVSLTITIFSQFSAQKLESILSSKTIIPQLEHLSLTAVSEISAQSILTILGSSKTSLIDLSFQRIMLCDDLTWPELLHRIGADFPHLKSFSIIGPVEQRATNGRFLKFVLSSKDELAEEYRAGLDFGGVHETKFPRIGRWRYNGANAGEFIKVMASKMVYD